MTTINNAVLVLVIMSSSHAATYQRGTYAYTIKRGATASFLGSKCSPEDDSDWFVQKEIATINHLKSVRQHLPRGRKVILPVYVKTNKFFVGDIRNWHVAVIAGHKFGVNPALLIAIRSHENPSRSADYKCCGVKWGSGWYPGGIWGQYTKAAEIIYKRGKKWGCDVSDPSSDFIHRLGVFYAEGSTEWGECVNELFRRAER